MRIRPASKSKAPPNIYRYFREKILTGSAVAILQISFRRESANWTELGSRGHPIADMRSVSSLAGRFTATPPLLQTKAWRAPRLEESVRQRDATRTPNFSVLHVSSLESKAPISVHRYCCFLSLSCSNFGCSLSVGPCVLSRGS